MGTKSIARQARGRISRVRRFAVDDGVTNQQRVGRRRDVGHEGLETCRVGLTWKRPVTAKHSAAEVLSQAERVEDDPGRADRFVGQHRQRGITLQPREQVWDAVVGAGVAQQATVVHPQETLQRIGRLKHPRGREGAGDERRGAVTNHPTNGFFAVSSPAAFLEDQVSRIGQIPARVDERAVEVEDDEIETTGSDVTGPRCIPRKRWVFPRP